MAGRTVVPGVASMLRDQIHLMPGKTWDLQVIAYAELAEVSRGAVYRWLCTKPPKYLVDAMNWRLSYLQEPRTQTEGSK